MQTYRVVVYQDGLRISEQRYNTLEGARACYDREALSCRDDSKRGVMFEKHGRDGWNILKAFTNNSPEAQ